MFKKIILTLILTITALSAAESETLKVNWEENFHKAMVKAQEENKPVLFIYSNHKCKFCVQLDNTALKDKKVIEALNKDFISVISYTDENDYTPGEFRSPGTPYIWFLYPNTAAMFQPIPGAVNSEYFLDAIASVKEEFAKNWKSKTPEAKDGKKTK